MSHVIDVERVQAEAQRVDIGRALLTLLIGFFWLLGWLAGRTVFATKTAVAAVKVGWRAGIAPNGGRR